MDGTMLGSKVIEALDRLRPLGPIWPSEALLLGAIETELRKLGVRFMRRPVKRARRPVLVVDSTPNLLVLISLAGDTEAITEAAAQLHFDQKALPLTRPVVVLGTPLAHVALRKALSQLGIILVECA